MNLHTRCLAAALCAVLCACGSTDMKESLGLNRKAPDEFQVYARPPLTVPPEFSLRPPGQGGGNTASVPAQEKAHNEILGAPGATGNLVGTQLVNPAAPAALTPTAVPVVQASELPTTADAQFLASAGATKADPNIRQEIGQPLPAVKDSTYLLGAKKDGDSEVDATKEAQRLKQDKATNQPPTAGETPVIAPESKGLLGDIF